ncbi:MAG: hypothetical protein QOE36_1773 [Gaiellaceae bacterium]|jgi:hypothetical protein|nr:hypothetical protein [Gaiellaceae bacterium]
MTDSRHYLMFRAAVLELSEEATAVNVRRYLVASRLLDRPGATGSVARRPRPPRPKTARS